MTFHLVMPNLIEYVSNMYHIIMFFLNIIMISNNRKNVCIKTSSHYIKKIGKIEKRCTLFRLNVMLDFISCVYTVQVDWQGCGSGWILSWPSKKTGSGSDLRGKKTGSGSDLRKKTGSRSNLRGKKTWSGSDLRIKTGSGSDLRE